MKKPGNEPKALNVEDVAEKEDEEAIERRAKINQLMEAIKKEEEKVKEGDLKKSKDKSKQKRNESSSSSSGSDDLDSSESDSTRLVDRFGYF